MSTRSPFNPKPSIPREDIVTVEDELRNRIKALEDGIGEVMAKITLADSVHTEPESHCGVCMVKAELLRLLKEGERPIESAQEN